MFARGPELAVEQGVGGAVLGRNFSEVGSTPSRVESECCASRCRIIRVRASPTRKMVTVNLLTEARRPEVLETNTGHAPHETQPPRTDEPLT